jgi:hypothetical protein
LLKSISIWIFILIEESFAALIAFIFIKESVFKLIDINKTNKFSNDPLNYVAQHSNGSCSKCVLVNSGSNLEYSNISEFTSDANYNRKLVRKKIFPFYYSLYYSQVAKFNHMLCLLFSINPNTNGLIE